MHRRCPPSSTLLRLDSSPLPLANTVPYLSLDITRTDIGTSSVIQRIRKAHSALAQLQRMGFVSSKVQAGAVLALYQIRIRPIYQCGSAFYTYDSEAIRQINTLDAHFFRLFIAQESSPIPTLRLNRLRVLFRNPLPPSETILSSHGSGPRAILEKTIRQPRPKDFMMRSTDAAGPAHYCGPELAGITLHHP